MKRKIENILETRSDISPFLIHLTRDSETKTAKKILENGIIIGQNLKAGKKGVSAATYTTKTRGYSDKKRKDFFQAVCFTEAPISELHCFFDIEYRNIDLEPYGIVFLKDKLKRKGVSPVFYINNYGDDISSIFSEFCDCITTNYNAAREILPLIASMGKKLNSASNTPMDFSWEREWRYPAYKGHFGIEYADVFIGLCPHDEILYFESLFWEVHRKSVPFIDPTRNIKYYADKLNTSMKKRDLVLGHIF